MATPTKDLELFGQLSENQIEQLADFFDEKILTSKPNMEQITKIIGNEFSEVEINKLLTAFYNFFRSKKYPERIFSLIKPVNIPQEKKDFLVKIVKKIHDKIDDKKIQIETEKDYLQDFGHPHIHDLIISPEFRPIFDNDKIIKFVPSLVFNGSSHNPKLSNHEKEINFQTDLDGAETLKEDLEDVISELKSGIIELRKKFGDDIID